MKRTIAISLLVVALLAVVAGSALAAGTVRGISSQTTPPAAQDGAVTCPMGGAGGGMMGGRPEWAGQPDAVADLLGMTAAEIQAERQAGKSLAQIASAKGVSTETLVNTILGAKKELLATLVADGKLSQEQADAMIARMQTQIKTMVERTTTGPAMGRGQGMRGGMGATMRGGMGRGMRGQDMRGWQQDRSY